jgi:RimJ/RimL family protein N-acetyltransferase
VSDGVPEPTERLVFRCWRDSDLDLAMALWGDPRVSALVGGPFSEAQVRDRLALEIETQRVHGFSYWPIAHANKFVGCCGLKPRSADAHELGFYLRPDAWGQGYAVEAGRAVIAKAFTFPIVALFAGHHPGNVASRRTLEKLGFRYTHDELYPPTGLLHPGYELRRS